MDTSEKASVDSLVDLVVAVDQSAEEPVGEPLVSQPSVDPSLADPGMASVAQDRAVTPQGGVVDASQRPTVATEDEQVSGVFTPVGATGGSPVVVAGHGAESRSIFPPSAPSFVDLPVRTSLHGVSPVDHGRTFGRGRGPYELPPPLCQHAEHTSTPGRAGLAPVTVGAQTSTTTTVTSTVATTVAMARPVYDPYIGRVPLSGPALARPVHPAAVSQFIDSSGRLPGEWAGFATPPTYVGDFPTEFDGRFAASRPLDRAVGPARFDGRYPYHSQGDGPAAVPRQEPVPQGGYGARPKTAGSAGQTESAWADARPLESYPGPGMPSQDSRAAEVGYGQPIYPGRPRQSWVPNVCPPPGIDSGAAVFPAPYWDGSTGRWVQPPTGASGPSLSKPTTSGWAGGFMSEARGTRPPTDFVRPPQCDTGVVPPTSTPQASAMPVGVRGKHPLFKLQHYDGSASLDTFLLKFHHMARYLRWDEEDQFSHLCASLDGPAGQVLWELPPTATIRDLERLLQTRFGTQMQAERYKAELRTRRRAKGESLQALYQDVHRLLQLAYPGADDSLATHVGKEAFINALENPALQLELLKREPATLEAALNHAVKMEAYEQSLATSTVMSSDQGGDRGKSRSRAVFFCDRKTGRQCRGQFLAARAYRAAGGGS